MRSAVVFLLYFIVSFALLQAIGVSSVLANETPRVEIVPFRGSRARRAQRAVHDEISMTFNVVKRSRTTSARPVDLRIEGRVHGKSQTTVFFFDQTGTPVTHFRASAPRDGQALLDIRLKTREAVKTAEAWLSVLEQAKASNRAQTGQRSAAGSHKTTKKQRTRKEASSLPAEAVRLPDKGFGLRYHLQVRTKLSLRKDNELLSHEAWLQQVRSASYEQKPRNINGKYSSR